MKKQFKEKIIRWAPSGALLLWCSFVTYVAYLIFKVCLIYTCVTVGAGCP